MIVQNNETPFLSVILTLQRLERGGMEGKYIEKTEKAFVCATLDLRASLMMFLTQIPQNFINKKM